jgi:hypothetical protein
MIEPLTLQLFFFVNNITGFIALFDLDLVEFEILPPASTTAIKKQLLNY